MQWLTRLLESELRICRLSVRALMVCGVMNAIAKSELEGSDTQRRWREAATMCAISASYTSLRLNKMS